MSPLGMIGKYEIETPTLRRRLALLVAVCFLGSLGALASISLVGWRSDIVAVFAIALLAGFSALWSP